MDQIDFVNESEKKKSERKYVIPEVKCNFPVKSGPFHEIPENKDWIQWIYKFAVMSPKQFKKIQGVGLYVHRFYSFCTDITRMEILVKAVVLFFVIDDHTEFGYGQIAKDLDRAKMIWGQIGQMLDKLEGNTEVDMVLWEPYIFSFYASLGVMYRSFNEVQKKRFLKGWRLYMEGNIEETEFCAQRKKHKSVEEMNETRFKVGAVMIIFQYIEYADQMFVPEQVWEDPRMQQLMRLGALHMTEANDLYSFEVEENENNDLNQLFNVVAVLAVTEKLSIKQSMEKVVQMLGELENKFFELEKEILIDVNCPNYKITRDFIERIKYAIGANFSAQSVLDRYNQLY